MIEFAHVSHQCGKILAAWLREHDFDAIPSSWIKNGVPKQFRDWWIENMCHPDFRGADFAVDDFSDHLIDVGSFIFFWGYMAHRGPAHQATEFPKIAFFFQMDLTEEVNVLGNYSAAEPLVQGIFNIVIGYGYSKELFDAIVTCGDTYSTALPSPGPTLVSGPHLI